MNSKEKLAQALLHAGLPMMAQLAREGYYHDFESPLSDPAVQLDKDLMNAIKGGNVAATLIRKWHHDGQFDAGLDESEAWAKSPEGQAAFDEIAAGDPPEAARERLRCATLMGDAIRAMVEAVPDAQVVIIMQRLGATTYDCATNVRQINLVELLRAYADHIESFEAPPQEVGRHDA